MRMLWVGDRLSVLEQLAVRSFLANGHRLELFTYGPVANVPHGAVIRDGHEILPGAKPFTYRKVPSYSAFSNWFRYALLHQEGGVWADTDVVCLRPLDLDMDLFFGLEEHGVANCAVIGARRGLPLFRFLAHHAEHPHRFLPYDSAHTKRKKLRRRFLRGNRRGDVKWGETGPAGFTRALEHHGLLDQALPVTAFYPIHSACWHLAFDGTYPDVDRFFPNSYAIHLWNEKLRADHFDKDGPFPDNSLVAALLRRYPEDARI